ncbi:TPA: hypothetical protein EYO12_03260 [Candidatus Saccharibacteria bacterium]|nr:hypothetical protein [Candidatus Saccharibacteria bacterium]HIO87948.1 hypothetical protein [Candidatus Saccharibacteria bacterium]
MISTELKTAVTNYTMPKSAQDTVRSSGFVVMVGITAAGKNTLITELINTGNYMSVVSHTTRQPRANNGVMEQDGREYWFVKEAEMVNKLDRGEMLEAKVIHNRQVSGVSVDELERAIRSNKKPINEIDVQGVEAIRAFYPELLCFFVLPPDFDTWQQRMQRRGDLSEDETMDRLQTAVEEIEHVLTSGGYIFVVNDDLADTARYVDDIITGKLDPDERKERSQKKAERLLNDLKAHLNNRTA